MCLCEKGAYEKYIRICFAFSLEMYSKIVSLHMKRKWPIFVYMCFNSLTMHVFMYVYTLTSICVWCLYTVVLVLLSQLYEGVKPTLGELEKFEATPDEVELNGTLQNTPHVCNTMKHVCI